MKQTGRSLIIRMILIIAILGNVKLAYPQDDIVGSGRALRFDGVDDLIDLGNIYDDVALPITISVWIYLDHTTQPLTVPIIDSQENSLDYNGFTFIVSTISHIAITYGDGHGGNNPAYRRSKAVFLNSITGRWAHITVIMRAATDMDIYLNGYNVGGGYEGSSNFPLNSNSPSEVAKIGHHFSNGINYRYKGVMDELRIWNRSLSQQEIRENMCRRLQGNEAGLIGYWNFDETNGNVLKDLSSHQFDGELKGNPTRVFSGAPIGDESVFLYTNNWNGSSLVKDNLSVVNVSGNPNGVHIYKVNHIPSQTEGLNIATIQSGYYGIFLASDDADNTFDLSVGEDNLCNSFQRTDNSIPAWVTTGMLSGLQERLEIIPTFEAVDLVVNLGADTTLCDKTSFSLIALEDAIGKTFFWNTGEAGSAITVTTSGEFSVQVTGNCKMERDTIQVLFLNTPPAFSLGENELSCGFEPRILSADLENEDFDFTWHDGSKEKSFQANDFGLYWLKIENDCGVFTDSVRFTRADLSDYMIPNIITPNGDSFNQHFILHPFLVGSKFFVYNRWGKEVYGSASYQNDWDGGDLPSGVYYYTISGVCLKDKKGAINIRK